MTIKYNTLFEQHNNLLEKYKLIEQEINKIKQIFNNAN